MNKTNLTKRKIDSLDSSYPLRHHEKERIWQNIEGRIKKRKEIRHLYWRYAAIAATISILAVAHIEIMSNDDVSYTTSEEIVHQLEKDGSDVMKMETDAIEFIHYSCEANIVACDTPEFKELKQELDQLDQEIQHLDEMISMYGKDEFLIKSKIKIENHKSEITRKLVQILIS